MKFNGDYFMKLHEDTDHHQIFFKGKNPEYLILSKFEKLFHGIT